MNLRHLRRTRFRRTWGGLSANTRNPPSSYGPNFAHVAVRGTTAAATLLGALHAFTNFDCNLMTV
jgi:hypothetical protein